MIELNEAKIVAIPLIEANEDTRYSLITSQKIHKITENLVRNYSGLANNLGAEQIMLLEQVADIWDDYFNVDNLAHAVGYTPSEIFEEEQEVIAEELAERRQVINRSLHNDSAYIEGISAYNPVSGIIRKTVGIPWLTIAFKSSEAYELFQRSIE